MPIKFKPSDILRKKPFEIITPGMCGPGVNANSVIVVKQSDFLRQFYVSGHLINDRTYYKDKIKRIKIIEEDSEGNEREVKRNVPYFVERVAIPYPEMIATKQLTAITGNNVAFSIPKAKVTDKMEDTLDLFVQGWQEHDMEIAVYEFLKSDKRTGDAAFCGFIDGGKFGWKVFSYEDGDELFPHYDKYGRLDAFGRVYEIFYNERKVRCLDVWDKDATYSFRQGDDSEALNTETYDGWTLVEGPVPHGFPFIPIVYHRTGYPCWAPVQNLIDKIEMAYSRLAENNKAFALRILFTKGADLDMQSTFDGTPIAVHSEESDADAKFLEPANESTSFKSEIEALEDAIYRGSFTVKTPEVRGSDLSGLAVELLFTDSTQKAICDAQEYKKSLNEIIRTFKWGFGVEAVMGSDMEKLSVFGEIIPYLPKSETEEVSNIVQLKSVGALSQRTAAEIGTRLGYGKNAEYNRLTKEEREKLLAGEPQPKQNTTTQTSQNV